jgi:molybdate transport system substrate-binding protein
LLVAAAYDLKPAFEELGTIFEEQAEAKVTFSFGSSGLLAQQIEGGLPADIYVAADIQHVERLREKGLIIADTQQVYAVGRLALASRPTGPTLSELETCCAPKWRRWPSPTRRSPPTAARRKRR